MHMKSTWLRTMLHLALKPFEYLFLTIKRKICDNYIFESASLEVEVSPFSTETEFKKGPYLTLVDKCPFVHETAVNVAEKVQHGRPISKRLCKVLEDSMWKARACQDAPKKHAQQPQKLPEKKQRYETDIDRDISIKARKTSSRKNEEQTCSNRQS